MGLCRVAADSDVVPLAAGRRRWLRRVRRRAHAVSVADRAGLPRDGFVYHYHPLTFIQWVNEKILETAADPSMQNETVNASDTAVTLLAKLRG